MKESQKKDLRTWLEKLICETFELENPELLAHKTRKREVLIPRQLSIVILVLSGKTLAKATSFYKRDHATANNSKKRIFEILETKDSKHDYNRIVKVIKQARRVFPEVCLSDLPRGWDDPNQRFCKS
jgi:chromosomal replication initiation ATPase DnaA